MRKLTDEELARLLRSGRAPAPPPGLAERIKAEIPQRLEVGGRGLETDLGRRRPFSVRSLWLLAASLLIVIGAGFVAVELLRPGRNLARELALDGLVVPDAYEIVVPPRALVERTPAPAPVSPSPTPGA